MTTYAIILTGIICYVSGACSFIVMQEFFESSYWKRYQARRQEKRNTADMEAADALVSHEQGGPILQ